LPLDSLAPAFNLTGMMRLADYVAQTLVRHGVKHVFLVTGGGAMHLNDALGRCPGLEYVCCHHEQACSMAAEAYARVTNSIGVVNVTTGPGGINALNGVFGAFTDSIPLLIVSGQVKRETLLATHGLTGKLRQLGDQEVDIIAMVGNITKSAVVITDPTSIRYHLERALHLATTGRPGPCWIDIPVDVQASQIDPDALRDYDPAEDKVDRPDILREQCREVVRRLGEARRPVLMVGSGIHLSGAQADFEKVIRRLGIPVTTAWTAIDVIASNDPLYCGRPGVVGERAGNFCVQNADLVIVIGCRLPIRQVSYNWPSFARHAFKIQVDIDPAELEKPIMVRPDLGIVADCGDFLRTLLEELGHWDAVRGAEWVAWNKERQEKYPVVLPRHRDPQRPINPYHFVEILFRYLGPRDLVACGDASASVITFQAARIQLGQRVFTNAGSASMGYDLPAAVGAAFSRRDARTICLAGEGSVMMNLQELQTVAHHHLSLKIIVMNNGGYLSIRSTQKNFFNHLVGEGPESGVTFPDFVRVGAAFGLPSIRLENPHFEDALAAFLAEPGPGLAEVMLDREQSFEPKLSSRQLPDGRMVTANLEDMAPFLDRDELKSNLLHPEDIALCQNT
jgi:acetolactate synthase-1/2/3 large subunit